MRTPRSAPRTSPWAERTRCLRVVGITALSLTALTAASLSVPVAANATPRQSGSPRSAPVVDIRSLHAGAHQVQRTQFRHPQGQAQLDQAKALSDSLGANTQSDVSTTTTPSSATPSPVPGTGWDGISSAESFCGCYPPDGAVAAGPNQVLATVNTAFKIWDKSGVLRTNGALNLGDLFLSNPDCLPYISDPFTSYDPAGRFILGALTYDDTYTSTICIAVSTGPDPTATWYVESFPVSPFGDLMDFPHVAIGSDAVYLTGNQFQGGATYVGVRAYAYAKSDMYAGLVHPAMTSVDIANAAVDTLWPAQGSPAGAAYFITADNSGVSGSTVSVYKWTAPYTSATFTRKGGVGVTPYLQPPNALQPSPGGPVTTGDARELGGQYFNGTIYGVHTVGCNPGLGTVACVQWYQVGTLDTTPTLIQQGLIAKNGEYRSYPNLATDRNGNVGIGYALSSTTAYPGIAFSGRAASDPAGTLQPEVTLKAGEAAIDGTRYGDFAGTVLDPNGVTIWHFEEYAKAGALWGTWVGSFSFGSTPPPPPPPPPSTTTMKLAASPTSFVAGGSLPVTVNLYNNGVADTTHTTAVTVSLTSTSASGRFYAAGAPTTPVTSITVAPYKASASFTYADTTAGSPTITAADQAPSGYGTASLGVSVTAGPLATLSVQPSAPPQMSVYSTQSFTAYGADAYGNPVAVAPTWSVNPTTLGSFSPQGSATTTFTATSAGTGSLTATSGTISSAPVPITVVATPPNDCQNC